MTKWTDLCKYTVHITWMWTTIIPLSWWSVSKMIFMIFILLIPTTFNRVANKMRLQFPQCPTFWITIFSFTSKSVFLIPTPLNNLCLKSCTCRNLITQNWPDIQLAIPLQPGSTKFFTVLCIFYYSPHLWP